MDARPLPDWLKLVTLRFEDSNQITTGLVQLPIPYSGPPIPLGWPYTQVQSPPPAPETMSGLQTVSALPAGPTPLQTITFLDGSGPFTVRDGIILTQPPDAAPSVPTPVATLTSVTGWTDPELSPVTPVIVVTTVLTAAATPTGNESPGISVGSTATYNSLVTGFIILLLVSVSLLLAIVIFAVKRRRKRNRSRLEQSRLRFEPVEQEPKYEFNSPLLPQHRHGSDSDRRQLEILRHQHHGSTAHLANVPVIKPNSDKDLDKAEANLLEVEVHESPIRSIWSRCKDVCLWPVKPFRTNPENQTIYARQNSRRRYQNPYHDPSVSTDTGVRVSRWRLKCKSPSPSLLYPSDVILDFGQDDIQGSHISYDSPVEDQSTSLQSSQSPKKHNLTGQIEEIIQFNKTSTISGSSKMGRGHLYQSIDCTPSTRHGKKLNPVLSALLERATHRSPSHSRSRRPSHLVKNASPRPQAREILSVCPRSKSGRSARDERSGEQFGESATLFRTEDLDEEADVSRGSEASDSPLDYVTVPLRSSPLSKRQTSNSPMRSPDAGPPSGPPSRPPLNPLTPKRRVRRKQTNLSLQSSNSPHDSKASGQTSSGARLGNLSSSSGLTPIKPLVLKKKDGAPTIYRSPRTPVVLEPSPGSAASGLGGDPSEHERLGAQSIESPSLSCLALQREGLHPNRDPNSGLSHQTSQQDIRSMASATEENILFTGYPDNSDSIGNSGGVTELGLLETPGVPHQLSSPHSQTSRGFLEDDLSCASGDLFYVKPAAAQPRKNRWTLGQSLDDPKPTGPAHGEDVSPSQSLEAEASGSNPRASSQDLSGSGDSSTKSSDDLDKDSRQGSDKGKEKKTIIVRCQLVGNPYLPFRAPSNLALDREEEEWGFKRRSVSSSVLGSIFSFSKNRRSASNPIGPSRESRFVDFNPILNESRSPLEKLIEKGQRFAQMRGHDVLADRDGEGVAEEDEEADERSRLLVLPESRGQTMTSVQETGLARQLTVSTARSACVGFAMANASSSRSSSAKFTGSDKSHKTKSGSSKKETKFWDDDLPS